MVQFLTLDLLVVAVIWNFQERWYRNELSKVEDVVQTITLRHICWRQMYVRIYIYIYLSIGRLARPLWGRQEPSQGWLGSSPASRRDPSGSGGSIWDRSEPGRVLLCRCVPHIFLPSRPSLPDRHHLDSLIYFRTDPSALLSFTGMLERKKRGKEERGKEEKSQRMRERERDRERASQVLYFPVLHARIWPLFPAEWCLIDWSIDWLIGWFISFLLGVPLERWSSERFLPSRVLLGRSSDDLDWSWDNNAWRGQTWTR